MYKLPPAFPYAEGDAQGFVAAARHAVCEMSMKGVPFSANFHKLLRDDDYAISSESCDDA